MTFAASVEIHAGAADVFALVSDLRRKARLNPNIEVIRVELEGGEPDPPFEVRVTVEPTPGGCRLTQQEVLEVGPEVLDALDPGPARERTFRDVLRRLPGFPVARPLGAELRALQRERAARRLASELEAWLVAIRAHVEVPAGVRGDRPANWVA